MIKPVRRTKPMRRRRRRKQQKQADQPSGRFASALDSLISTVAPQWAMRRKATRALSGMLDKRIEVMNGPSHSRGGSGYDAASYERIRGERWLASDTAPDAILEQDQEDLLNRADDLYRSNTIYHAAIESRVAHEIGVGMTPQARVRPVGGITDDQAKEINLAIESSLERWSSRGIDKQRRDTISQMQRVADRSFANYGEVFALLGDSPSPNGGMPMTVDLINPTRVSTPPEKMADKSVRMGIQYSETNEIQGYWVRTTDPREVGIYFEYKWEYYPRFDREGQPRMLHVFDPLVPGQTRGTPWLTAAFGRVKDLDDFHEAELIAKQIEACFGLIFTQDSDEPLSPHDIATGNSSETRNGRRIEDLEPGLVHYARQGEDVKTIDPQRPGASFAPFVESSLRSIAAAGNYPYELLAKNFFRTTFSSGQLALIDGSYGFSLRRSVLTEQLLAPIYRRFLFEAVFLDEAGPIEVLTYIARPWLYERHVWQHQGRQFLNPRDETKARVTAVDNDMATLSDIHAEQGNDFAEKSEQRKVERMKLAEDDVAVRKHQWDLEEAAGLPHAESDPAAETDDETSAQNEQDQLEEANA